MKIILIKPPFSPEEEFGDLSLMGSCEPPLGLCYLAANLRKNKIDVEIIDSIALRLNFKETADKVISSNAMCIGLSAETPTICNAAKLAGMIKSKKPDITTIIGGTHITALPEKTMESYPQFDFGVLGEGESTLPELLKCMNNGGSMTDIPGLIIKIGDNKAIQTEPREPERCLDSLPMPAWDMLPPLSKHYYLSFYSVKKRPSLSLVTSRGCGFKCTFCYQGVFGKKARRHSAEYIMDMILELYHTHGMREIRFQDDIFLSDEKRLTALCNLLIEERLDISWSCLARVDKINKKSLEIMKKAGCWQILMGIESGSQKILTDIKKGTSPDQIEKAVKTVHQAGIRCVGYFMIGYPTETKKTVKDTITFARKIPLDDFRMNFIAPFPGTEIHAIASESGTLTTEWSNMNFFKGPCYIPENLTRREIIHYRRMAFILFYCRPHILLSYLLMLRCRSDIKNLFTGWRTLIKYIIRTLVSSLQIIR